MRPAVRPLLGRIARARRFGSGEIWLVAFFGLVLVIALILYAVRARRAHPRQLPTAAASLAPPPSPPSPTPSSQSSPDLRQLRVVWTVHDKTPLRAQPGLNVEPFTRLPKGSEIHWVRTMKSSPWDFVELDSGKRGWVESPDITFIRPSTFNTPTRAELVVIDFYDKVARKDYNEAYAHLSSEWKRQLSFSRFVQGYSRTWSLRTEVTRVVKLGRGRYQVDVGMVADEQGQDVNYQGIYTVGLVDQRWEMTSGELKRLPGSSPARPL